MDRMDCQMLMITFSSIHYATFVEPRPLSVEQILNLVAMMAPYDILTLQTELTKRIENQQLQSNFIL